MFQYVCVVQIRMLIDDMMADTVNSFVRDRLNARRFKQPQPVCGKFKNPGGGESEVTRRAAQWLPPLPALPRPTGVCYPPPPPKRQAASRSSQWKKLNSRYYLNVFSSSLDHISVFYPWSGYQNKN